MKIPWWKGATPLLLGGAFFIVGCSGSGQQQTQEQVEQQQEAANSEDGDEAESNEESANTGEGGESNEASLGVAQETPDNDLANIINEMNQQANQGVDQSSTELNEQNTNPSFSMNSQAQPSQFGQGGLISGSAGVAAVNGMPEFGSKLHYVVVKGDTLGAIAKRILGDLGRWKELAQMNDLANPHMIYPGDVIYYQLTEETLTFAQAYEAQEQLEVVVQSGDTLTSISKRYLGDSGQWRYLWRLNGQLNNPNQIVPGMKIKLGKSFLKGNATYPKASKVNIQSV